MFFAVRRVHFTEVLPNVFNIVNYYALYLLFFKFRVTSDGMFILINLNISLIGAQLALIGAENSFESRVSIISFTA